MPSVQSKRLVSIDILRGFTMLVMIFVNDVGEAKGLPWWTYHMPGNQNGMTYVDVVFPVFLFIVGLSIPLAIERRDARGDSVIGLWSHIALRSFGLVAIGLVLANASQVDAARTGLSENLWGGLGLMGAILFWLVYPDRGPKALYRILKYGGLALLVGMFAIFRRDGGQWLNFSYWEILGLIGRAYFIACLLYIPLRKRSWAPLALFIALTAISVLERMGDAPWLVHLAPQVLPADSIALASIVMAGIAGVTLLRTRGVEWAWVFALVLLIAGWITTPLGINKIRATPAWCLLCSGIGMVLFLALYRIADIGGHSRWADFLKPAGSNTLLTYLLPDLVAFSGFALRWTGVAKSVVFTAAILAISAVLTRWKIRFQL